MEKFGTCLRLPSNVLVLFTFNILTIYNQFCCITGINLVDLQIVVALIVTKAIGLETWSVSVSSDIVTFFA